MEELRIRGGQIEYSRDNQSVYRILEGHALVYLVPFKDGVPGRRLFLGEFEEGELIPAFRHDSEMLGAWRIGIMALDQLTMGRDEREIPGELILQFAARINLDINSADSFGEALIEIYEMETVRTEGYIYASENEKEVTRRRTLKLIYDVMAGKIRGSGTDNNTQTGNALYDAAATVCDKERIVLQPLKVIQDACGKRFTLRDAARISHFTIREITLEEKWYKQDNGTILAFADDGRTPLACIPKGTHKYIAYDPKKEEHFRVTDAAVKRIMPKAYMFYRPFPDKPIGRKDLLLFGIQKVHPSDVVRLVILALVGTLIGLLLPLMNEVIFDKFIPMGDRSGLWQLGAVLLAVSIGNIGFTVVRNLASFRSMNAMEYATQSAALDRLFCLPESFFRSYDSAELGQKVMGISMIYQILADSIVTSVMTALFSFLYLYRMYQYSAQLSGWALVLLVLVAAFILFIGFRQICYERDTIKLGYKTNSKIFQFLSAIAKLRISAAEDRALYHYLEDFTELRRITINKQRMSVFAVTVSDAAMVLFSVMFFLIMVRKSVDLSIGQFTGFMAAFGAFAGAILTLVQKFLSVNMIGPMYQDVRPILETLPESSADNILPGGIQGSISIDNLTFGYSDSEEPVLRNLSLHIRKGEYVGIVGASGCGKSTLLKLLLGFEKPQLGKIYYDSLDIDELDKRELRKKFGVVLQEGGLIAGSIYENITITSPNCRMSRVEAAVRAVGLAEDIKAMPMGLHTMIAEGAGTISGGQAQRILIARAIVNMPKVIFLDEATSALDNVAQKMVVDTLERLDATKIVIAHRLSTVKNCDRIIVLDKGTIAEQGSYDELMAMQGMFYELAKRQIE
ncbi:MAG: NHLP bacteriocin export ABC transporter permease/ATPase subunit [Oscillospiraceae bacterium]|nr:NHLP bacteriocin export ABC transporter permease/ATPase subunit [Oscillospiraceae bacterium]